MNTEQFILLQGILARFSANAAHANTKLHANQNAAFAANAARPWSGACLEGHLTASALVQMARIRMLKLNADAGYGCRWFRLADPATDQAREPSLRRVVELSNHRFWKFTCKWKNKPHKLRIVTK